MPSMIGLSGRAGAGKSYVAWSLLRMLNYWAIRGSFAAELRWEIEAALGLDQSASVLWAKPTSPEVRRLLQWWGTDFRRAEDPDYWVKKAMARYEKAPLPVVFDDVRFPNEADAIRANGGLLVRVLAPIEVREQRLGTLPPEHASETAMDYYPVDMHITSTEENPVFQGQLTRIVFEATVDKAMEAIRESLDRRS